MGYIPPVGSQVLSCRITITTRPMDLELEYGLAGCGIIDPFANWQRIVAIWYGRLSAVVVIGLFVCGSRPWSVVYAGRIATCCTMTDWRVGSTRGL